MSEAPRAPAVPQEPAEELYEHAPCGHLSTLPDGTIIKVNATLLSWLGLARDDLVGRRRFADLLTAGGRIYHETHYAPLLAMQGSVRAIAVDLAGAAGRRLPVLVSSTLVREADGSPRVIRTSVFDATDRREYERELLRARQRAEASEARARVLAETLQRSLIPPSPPAIPGLDLSAAYRPAGAGDEVGGDFYDVFAVGGDDWAIVLGDVCGKGAEAAVVTALARHTVREAAMRDPEPAAVLSALNDALLRGSSDRFCTAVYLWVRPGAAGGAEVALASGGHPLPLRLGGDGVEAVGRSGDLLGVFASADVDATTLVLGAGEALFCYTDGLTEGRRGDELYGDQRLLAALAARRGRPADELAPAIVEEVLAFQEGNARDDMAAVAIGVPRGPG